MTVMKSMIPQKIHCFQHVAFEDLGCISHWIDQNNHLLTCTKFYENHSIPEPEEYDWLIIMGGPMGIYDEKEYPWLEKEKKAIKEAIENNKIVLGICLGSQLIADALGEKVYRNPEKEIGWFDIHLTEQAKTDSLFGENSAEHMMVFHWHGDTYHLPEKSKHLAYSTCCTNQAFLYKNNVLGLQFHLEVTEESIGNMVLNGGNELTGGKYIQSGSDILAQTKYIEANNKTMFGILNILNPL
ncbi:MAG: type 1 glutamine amidotransferase [Paludibacter sp.]|nr:type 1 glutamine amidotransferase [Paludibacter sp.]